MHIQYINNLILKLCKQPRTFEFITKELNGLDPIQLSSALKELECSGDLQQIDDLWTLKNKKKLFKLDLNNIETKLYLKKYMGYFDFLDKPHPLDFEWRHSNTSINYLINQIQDLNSIEDRILVLGMPTLFANCCIKDIPQKVTLLERNKIVVKGLSKLVIDKERFNILEKDITKVAPISIGQFFCVIMDPPWYSPFFYQFMWLAAQCVEIGGIVGISLPPINTRPNIDKERIEWLKFSQLNGLCLENLYAQNLHYVMPFFEYNAFRASGIKDFLPFWRKGDFALFRKVHSGSLSRPKIEEKSLKWVEKKVETVRIRIKINSDDVDNDNLKITHLVNGDILPTVSTRDKRREKANVWTSGNRIYHVNNPQKFIVALGNKKNFKKENKELIQVSNFIKSIIEIEKKEYNNYLDWLYHEMER